MKKILIALIPSLIVLCFILTLTPTKASTDELLFHLWGYVYYKEGGGSVGSGKPVHIYDSPSHIMATVYTNSAGMYDWGFSDHPYVYKVECKFSFYQGDSIIDQNLPGDTRIDIYVSDIRTNPQGINQ